MLMSYAFESGLGGHGMDELSERHLGHKPISFKDVAGCGRSKVTFDLVPVDRATHYAAEDADVTLRLWMLFRAELVAKSKTAVYETLERPLSSVLAEVEKHGVLVDRQVLARLSAEFAKAAAQVGGGDFRPLRRALQHRLDQAARRYSVRPDAVSPAAARRRPAPGAPMPAPSRILPPKAWSSPRKFCNGAS